MTDQDRQAFDPAIEPWGACHGPCQQGRFICPCPQACRLNLADSKDRTELWVGVALAITVLAVIAGLVLLWGMR